MPGRGPLGITRGVTLDTIRGVTLGILTEITSLTIRPPPTAAAPATTRAFGVEFPASELRWTKCELSGTKDVLATQEISSRCSQRDSIESAFSLAHCHL